MATDDCTEADGVFLWSKEEAERYHTSQVGPSACGATSVINALVRKDVRQGDACVPLKQKLYGRGAQ